MSERKQKPKFKKPYKKVTKSEPKQEGHPVEVLVYDVVNHERVVAEHRGESKWWFGTRLYKVYHPAFYEGEGGFRWVTKMGRVLGIFDPSKECPTPQAERAEANAIRRLMVDYREDTSRGFTSSRAGFYE